LKIQLKNGWNYLIGSALAFTLTTRAFHFVCLVSLLALAYNIPLNFAVGLPVVAVVSAVTLLLFTCLYFLSRVKRKTPLAISVFCLLGNILFIGNFFLNSGIDGPTSLFFVLAILVIVAIVPLSQYKYWVTGNILVVLSLHLLQYQYPDFIPITYHLKSDRYLDISSAYVSVVAVSILVFYFIRRSYEIEKLSAEEKAGALRLLNEDRNKLMSIIAHDLRSPLGNIQAYLELLVEINISEEEAKVITSKLLQATRGTLDMLNNVLKWTQSQMNGLNFTLGPVNVFKLLSSQLLMLMDIAANKGILLKYQLILTLSLLVMGKCLNWSFVIW
jgi:two-component system sensor histidine kinase/response regulator